jgi:hypothetical protein
MRYLVKARLPLDSGKPLYGDSSLRKAMGHILDENKVEALFFGEEHGKHCLFFIVNVRDAHRMPAITEPLRQDLRAHVDFMPARDPGSISRSLPATHRAVS